jgi:hypothetical protein
METPILIDHGSFAQEICVSISVVGRLIVWDEPQVIQLDEIACPLSSPNQGWLLGGGMVEQYVTSRLDDQQEFVPLDYEPPLLAAGRFTTVARFGALPPLEWDD